MELKYVVHRIEVSYTKKLRRGRTGPAVEEFYPSVRPSRTEEWQGGRFPEYGRDDTVTFQGRSVRGGKITLYADENAVHYNEDGSVATVKMFFRVKVDAGDVDEAREGALNYLKAFGFS